MIHKKRVLLSLLLCILLLACNSPWNAANRISLAANASEVLALTDETPPKLTCSMLGTTHSGYCLFTADEALIAEFTTRLGTDAQTASLADPSTVPLLVTDGETGCLDPDIFTT